MAERSSFYYVSSEYDKKEAIVLTQSTENVPAIFLNPSTNSFPLWPKGCLKLLAGIF